MGWLWQHCAGSNPAFRTTDQLLGNLRLVGLRVVPLSHNGWRVLGLFVQLLCNAGLTFTRFFEALHHQMQLPLVDV